MLKRIVLIISATVAFGPAAALLAASDAGQASPSFQQELIPSSPLSSQNILEAVWVLGIFLLMLIILYPTAWKQVLAGLKSREERIRKDIVDAEATRKKAEETLGQYNAQLATAQQKVNDLLAQAAVDAEKIATGIRAGAAGRRGGTRERHPRDRGRQAGGAGGDL